MMASNQQKKAGIPSIRGMLKKKSGLDADNLDTVDSTTMSSFQKSQPTGVFKSHSSSSIPSTLRRTVALVNSESSTTSLNESTHMMDQGTVLALTQDVRRFSDALANLHNVIHNRTEIGESLRVSTHERLGEVLCILKSILKQYPAVNSTDLLTVSGVLISRVKGFNYRDAESDQSELYDAIDQLALSFSSSVSEYLMGDMETSFNHSSSQTLDSPQPYTDNRNMDAQRELLSANQMDSHLAQMESGVELALERAKAWSKYAKDVISYIEKRTALEQDFSRGLAKISMQMRPAIMENSFLPLQSVFCIALDQDKEYSATLQASCTLIQNQKFLEPLSQRRQEHEKARKLLRDEWLKEVKKMNDAITNLKKCKLMYYQRSIEYEKAKEAASRIESESLGSSAGMVAIKQLDKKKKYTEECLMKVTEALGTYKQCVSDANQKQQELEKTKAVILSQVRELITLCERTMKAATIAYFQLQHTVTAPAPVQFQTLCENCRSYEPGMQYSEFIRRLPTDSTVQYDQFSFEPYVPDGADKSRKISGQNIDTNSSPHVQKTSMNCESESLSSGDHKSSDNSPSASPHSAKKNLNDSYHKDMLSESVSQHDKVAGHLFKKLRTLSKCRVCESYLYFDGAECEQCGIACHKKCLSNLTQQCDSVPAARRLTTFGVSFDDQVQNQKTEVPIIVTRCVQEIDMRGRDIKGIYRVSGVKSKVEKLCQSFEQGGEVDLDEHHPNVISNVLKLYLRQLPDPLMTVKLYPKFIEVAKEYAQKNLTEEEACEQVNKLKQIISLLPQANLKTAAVIIHHLKRVTQLEHENQMSSSNLGIVFGPTLLRPSEGPVNLDSLIDTAHQTRAVELLIRFSRDLFGPDPVQLSLTNSPIEEEDFNSFTSFNDSCDQRMTSIESNLTDEIMTALKSPRDENVSLQQSLEDSSERLDSIEELNFLPNKFKQSSDGISLDSETDDSDLETGVTSPATNKLDTSLPEFV